MIAAGMAKSNMFQISEGHYLDRSGILRSHVQVCIDACAVAARRILQAFLDCPDSHRFLRDGVGIHKPASGREHVHKGNCW